MSVAKSMLLVASSRMMIELRLRRACTAVVETGDIVDVDHRGCRVPHDRGGGGELGRRGRGC